MEYMYYINVANVDFCIISKKTSITVINNSKKYTAKMRNVWPVLVLLLMQDKSRNKAGRGRHGGYENELRTCYEAWKAVFGEGAEARRTHPCWNETMRSRCCQLSHVITRVRMKRLCKDLHPPITGLWLKNLSNNLKNELIISFLFE